MWRESPIDYFKNFHIHSWFYIFSYCTAIPAMLNKDIKPKKAYIIK